MNDVIYLILLGFSPTVRLRRHICHKSPFGPETCTKSAVDAIPKISTQGFSSFVFYSNNPADMINNTKWSCAKIRMEMKSFHFQNGSFMKYRNKNRIMLKAKGKKTGFSEHNHLKIFFFFFFCQFIRPTQQKNTSIHKCWNYFTLHFVLMLHYICRGIKMWWNE